MARKKRNTYGGRYIPVRSGSSKEDTKLCKVQILIQNLYIGVSYKGSTMVFGAIGRGSNPCTSAILKEKTYETQYYKKEKNKT